MHYTPSFDCISFLTIKIHILLNKYLQKVLKNPDLRILVLKENLNASFAIGEIGVIKEMCIIVYFIFGNVMHKCSFICFIHIIHLHLTQMCLLGLSNSVTYTKLNDVPMKIWFKFFKTNYRPIYNNLQK